MTDKLGKLHFDMPGEAFSRPAVVTRESENYWWVRDIGNGRNRRFRKSDGLLSGVTADPRVSLKFTLDV